jgi:hypothetical protein
MFGMFKRKPKTRLVINDYVAQQEALERSRELRTAQIEALTELGGFDTFFDDSEQNWARQAQVLVEFKRDIADLKQRIADLEAK